MNKETDWTENILLLKEVLFNHYPKEKLPSIGNRIPTFECNFCKSDWPCTFFMTAKVSKEKIEAEHIKAIKTHPSRTGTIPERHTFKGGENGQ